jgi:putative acetyltransferase
MISLKRTTCDNDDFQSLVQQLDQDLWARYPEEQHIYNGFNKITGIDTVVIAYYQGAPVGCGCFKPFGAGGVEVKRMFVQPGLRGKGIAYSILEALEQWAAELGYSYTVLETGTGQPEAIGLYKKSGYSETEKYPPYVDMPSSVCFRKELAVKTS